MEPIPDKAIDIERSNVVKMFPGPGNWIVPEDAWFLKECFGLAKSAQPLSVAISAAQLRVAILGCAVYQLFLGRECAGYWDKKLKIPIFAMVDTNSDPKEINYVIPSNDDASKSIECILSIVSKSITEGLEERAADQDKKAAEKKEKAKQISEGLEEKSTDQDEESDKKKEKSRKRIKE